jgi:putative transposase
MSRKHRIWFPGAVYHVTDRGNKQAPIFYDDQDHHKYLSLVKEAKELFPFTLHSYCLMYNHTHLLLETHKIPITDIMKYINSRYAIYFNKRYELNGHVFQGRYRSDLIIDASYFLNASRYIHLNPLEAKIVTTLENYPWSSFPSYLYSLSNPLVTTERVLSHFPEPKLKNYLAFLFAPNPTKKEAVPCPSSSKVSVYAE